MKRKNLIVDKEKIMAIYVCKVCGFQYDEEREGTLFDDIPEDWVCPVCGTPKFNFEKME